MERKRILPHLNNIEPLKLEVNVGDVACIWRLCRHHVDPREGPNMYLEPPIYRPDPLGSWRSSRFNQYSIFTITKIVTSETFTSIQVISEDCVGGWMQVGQNGLITCVKSYCYIKRIEN